MMDCCCGEQTEIEVPGGDFEFSPYPAPGGWIDYTDAVGPWTVDFGSISHHDDGHNNLGAGNPNPSTAHLDINGFSPGGICQTLSGFTVGQECTIVFYYAIHNAVSSASASLQIDGGAALDIIFDASNPGNVNWLEASYTFTATNTDMDICFASESFVSCCGMLLDDIQMFCCPADQAGPEFTDVPMDENYQCLDDVPDPYDVEANDDCTDDPDIEMEEEIIELDDCRYTVLREWYVEDDCGNTATYSQIIDVEDIEEPTVLRSPSDITLSCVEDADLLIEDWVESLGGADVFDNCGEISVYIIPDEFPTDSCGEFPVQFIYTDLCGLTAEDEAFVVIEDIQDPEFGAMPQNLAVPCGSDPDSTIVPWLQAAAFSQPRDNCNFSLINDYNSAVDSTQLITFAAIDDCGNSSTITAMLSFITDVDTILIDSTTCNPDVSGLFEEYIDSATGCDTLIIHNIQLLPSDTVIIDSSTCNPSESISDTIYYINQWGCDSIVYIDIFLLQSDTTTVDVATCNDLAVGLDSLVLNNQFDCDSLVIYNYYLTDIDTIITFNYSCNLPDIIMDTTVVAGTVCDTIIIEITEPIYGDTIVSTSFECNIPQLIADTTTVPGIPCDTVIINITEPVYSDTIIQVEYSCDIYEVLVMESNVPGMFCDTIIIDTIFPLSQDTVLIFEESCRLVEVGVDTIRDLNTVGCDSLTIIETNYNPPEPILHNEISCDGMLTGTDTIITMTGTCDSIFYIQYVPVMSDTSYRVVSVCEDGVANDSLWLINQWGCDSILVIEYEYERIDVSLQFENDPCDGIDEASFIINEISGGVEPYTIHLNGQEYLDVMSFVSLAPSVYTVEVSDDIGCMSSPITFTVPTDQTIAMDLVIQESFGNNAFLLNLSITGDPVNVQWSHPELLSCTDCNNPVATVSQDVLLSVTAESNTGCLAEAAILLEVEQIRMYIPNIFSADNDGVNDRFRIFPSMEIDVLSFQVFDRWGNMVFNAENFNTADDISWDGTFNNELLNSDVFVYRIEYIDPAGEALQFYGSVTLVR